MTIQFAHLTDPADGTRVYVRPAHVATFGENGHGGTLIEFSTSNPLSVAETPDVVEAKLTEADYREYVFEMEGTIGPEPAVVTVGRIADYRPLVDEEHRGHGCALDPANDAFSDIKECPPPPASTDMRNPGGALSDDAFAMGGVVTLPGMPGFVVPAALDPTTDPALADDIELAREHESEFIVNVDKFVKSVDRDKIDAAYGIPPHADRDETGEPYPPRPRGSYVSPFSTVVVRQGEQLHVSLTRLAEIDAGSPITVDDLHTDDNTCGCVPIVRAEQHVTLERDGYNLHVTPARLDEIYAGSPITDEDTDDVGHDEAACGCVPLVRADETTGQDASE